MNLLWFGFILEAVAGALIESFQLLQPWLSCTWLQTGNPGPWGLLGGGTPSPSRSLFSPLSSGLTPACASLLPLKLLLGLVYGLLGFMAWMTQEQAGTRMYLAPLCLYRAVSPVSGCDVQSRGHRLCASIRAMDPHHPKPWVVAGRGEALLIIQASLRLRSNYCVTNESKRV